VARVQLRERVFAAAADERVDELRVLSDHVFLSGPIGANGCMVQDAGAAA
jgi:hypothetical protein